ncbi:MAG: hypothetical protein WCK65_01330 [Rhodospirillaceae bacterium]
MVAGIAQEVVRNTLIAKGFPPALAATFPGVEHEVLRDAIAAKAVGGVGSGLAAKTIAASKTAGANAITTGGAVLGGKSFSLGLGIGLGAWGPILVVAAGAAAVYAYLQYRNRQLEDVVEDAVQSDDEATQDEGFMASQG